MSEGEPQSPLGPPAGVQHCPTQVIVGTSAARASSDLANQCEERLGRARVGVQDLQQEMRRLEGETGAARTRLVEARDRCWRLYFWADDTLLLQTTFASWLRIVQLERNQRDLDSSRQRCAMDAAACAQRVEALEQEIAALKEKAAAEEAAQEQAMADGVMKLDEIGCRCQRLEAQVEEISNVACRAGEIGELAMRTCGTVKGQLEALRQASTVDVPLAGAAEFVPSPGAASGSTDGVAPVGPSAAVLQLMGNRLRGLLAEVEACRGRPAVVVS